MNSYATDARFYDLWNTRADDVAFWAGLASTIEGRIAEVGCGTGRIAVPLASGGYDVTGIDPSAGMLELARQRAAAEDATVEWIEGDATAVAEHGPFGLVLLAADVFLNCADAEEQIAWLTAAREAAGEDGFVALDVPGPAMWLNPALDNQPVLVYSGDDGEGAHLDVWQVTADDLAVQERLLRVIYDHLATDGTVRRSYSEHVLRYVYPAEAELLLTASGIEITAAYGSYDLDPITSDSERMIFIATRSGE